MAPRTKAAKDDRDIKQVIVVRRDLKMGAGKTAAQAAHASLMSYIKSSEKNKTVVEKWLKSGGTKIVLRVDSHREFEELKAKLHGSNLVFCVIRDAGQTQIAPGTETAIGIGPDLIEKIDAFTGELPLL